MFTFRIKAPLYVVQEMLRHRIGTSFNQESLRYIEAGEGDPEFYVPLEFRAQSTKNKQSSEGALEVETPRVDYMRSLMSAQLSYKLLLKMGVCREQARGVLPHCTYTSLYFTLNARSLMHFLELRLHARAQWEIRQYAVHILHLAKQHMPVTLEIFRKKLIEDENYSDVRTFEECLQKIFLDIDNGDSDGVATQRKDAQ
jgi:thymidylate synthase (FAD)